MADEKKRCTKLKDASVYILADYRDTKSQKFISRLYTHAVTEGYDLNWVGYSEGSPFYSFTAGDRKVSFSPTAYDRFSEAELNFKSTMILVFVGIPENEDEEKEVMWLSTDFSEYRARKLLKIANDFQKSTETNVKKRSQRSTEKAMWNWPWSCRTRIGWICCSYSSGNMSLFNKGEERSDIKSVKAYVLADYRHRNQSKAIERMYAYSMDEGYDFEWIGYSESDEHCFFMYKDRKITFDPSVYDEYTKKAGRECRDDFLFILVADFEDPNVKPYVVAAYASAGSALEFKHMAKIVNDTVNNRNVKDTKRRFRRIKFTDGYSSFDGCYTDFGLTELLILLTFN